MTKTYVYIVMANKNMTDDRLPELWIVGVFYNRDRADECKRLVEEKPEACDGAYVVEEEILDAAVATA